MPAGMPNLLDLAKQRGNDVQVGLIEENIQSNPEMRIFPMRQIVSTAYKTLIRTGYPTAGFRHANEGVARSKSTFENRMVECFILDSQIAADKAIADAWDPGGAPAYQMIEAVGVLEAVMRTVSRQIYYGNTAAAVAGVVSDAKGFPGFIDAYDAANHEVDATGATARSSVWAVRLGIKDVHLIAGGGGLPNILPEWRIQTVNLDDNTAFTAYVNSLMGWIGMQVGAIHSLVRVKNIGVAEGKTMTDDLGSQALEKFPSGIRPDYFIMNRRSRRQLQQSRQAVAAVGGFQASTVPTPTDIEGVPILCTDAILNDEGAL
jgi:hypothetical protein